MTARRWLPTQDEWVDLGFLLTLSVLALVGLAPTFAGVAFAVVGVVGLVLGFSVRAVWRSVAGTEEPDRRTWVLLATLACAIVAGAAVGAISVIQYEQEAKPGVRVDQDA